MKAKEIIRVLQNQIDLEEDEDLELSIFDDYTGTERNVGKFYMSITGEFVMVLESEE
jgi:hypothetical protein